MSYHIATLLVTENGVVNNKKARIGVVYHAYFVYSQKRQTAPPAECHLTYRKPHRNLLRKLNSKAYLNNS